MTPLRLVACGVWAVAAVVGGLSVHRRLGSAAAMLVEGRMMSRPSLSGSATAIGRDPTG